NVAWQLLVDAAGSVAGQAPELAARLLLDATLAAWANGNVALLADTAARAAAVPAAGAGPIPIIPAITELARIAAREPHGAPRAIRAMMAAVRDQGGTLKLWDRANLLSWDPLSADHEFALELGLAFEQDCRNQGAFGVLPRALLMVASSRMYLGATRDAVAA